jgi:hypothetical protein
VAPISPLLARKSRNEASIEPQSSPYADAKGIESGSPAKGPKALAIITFQAAPMLVQDVEC